MRDMPEDTLVHVQAIIGTGMQTYVFPITEIEVEFIGLRVCLLADVESMMITNISILI